MKQMYKDTMKNFLHSEITRTVSDKKLTVDKAAAILNIDPRSFAYLKSGKTMCSATTLIVYLVKMCPDYNRFIDEASKIISEIEKQYD